MKSRRGGHREGAGRPRGHYPVREEVDLFDDLYDDVMEIIEREQRDLGKARAFFTIAREVVNKQRPFIRKIMGYWSPNLAHRLYRYHRGMLRYRAIREEMAELRRRMGPFVKIRSKPSPD
jgi:hypothetical protein